MKVSVLGLGIIGEIWARHLAEDGLLAAVWNRSPKPGVPGWESSAKAAAAAGDIVMVVVADPQAVESVLSAIEPVLCAGKTVIQSSTIDPESSLRFAERVKATGAQYLEAPFTGSKPAAAARETVFYLGGENLVVKTVTPVLERISKKIFHVGSEPQAATLKLAMNLQIAAQAEALCESIYLARQAGISDDQFFECLGINVAKSGLTDLKEPKLRQREYSAQFSIKHMHKDLRLATSGPRAGLLPLTEKVRDIFQQTEDAGLGDEDFIVLYKMLKDR
jgi:glyoxylate/succinic semialdehyde reductase